MTKVENNESIISVPFWSIFSLRFYIALLLMFVTFSYRTMRDNMGIAVVCMVNTTSYTNQVYDNITILKREVVPSVCSKSFQMDQTNDDTAHKTGTFNWTPDMQSLLFSVTFYGGIPTVLFSGYFADRYGPNLVIILGLSFNVLLSFLAPLTAEWDFYAFVFIRFCMGIAAGTIQPAIAAMVPSWFPTTERSTATAIYTSGFQLGIFITLAGAKLCTILNGWQLIFYVGGIVGVCCLFLWCLFASNTPHENKFISDKEKNFLLHQNQDWTNDKNKQDKKAFRVPWLAMLTSMVTISVLTAGFALEFQYTLMQSFLPSYLRDILYIDIGTNGLFSTIPFITQIIMKNIFAIFVDKWQKSGFLGITTSCKILTALAAFGTSAILLGLGVFVDCTNPVLALILLFLYGVVYAGFIPGVWTALLCIAPNYSGTLASVFYFITNISKILASTVVGIINKTGSSYEWRLIFVIAAGINIFAGIFFIFYGSAETQKWNEYKQKNSNKISGGEIVSEGT